MHPGRRIDRERTISVRLLERSDAPNLSDFYASLSPESRRRRFLGHVARDDRALADRFTGHAGEGLVAILAESSPRDGLIVAHATVQRDGPGEAEIALAVADEFQGMGIGGRLMEAATKHARQLGMHRLNALMYADNTPMRRLLRATGPVLSDEIDAGIEEMSVAV
ncbi:MAG: GNAT family N-acetyltransferase [Candidatus Limnocylindria bacterium]